MVIPTYDERTTLQAVLDRLRVAIPTAHALVVDDASPDGTGALADEPAADDDRTGQPTLNRLPVRGRARRGTEAAEPDRFGGHRRH